MQLGISTYTFPWSFHFKNEISFSFRELINFANEHNINRVQFGDNYPLHTLTSIEQNQLKQLAEQNNITIEIGMRGLQAENVLQYLDIAKFLKSPFLRIVVDDNNYEPTVEETIGLINKLLPHFIENNIVLAIENHDRFSAKDLHRIVSSTNEQWVNICLDTANSLGAGETINEIFPVLLPHTINLHIKNIVIKTGTTTSIVQSKTYAWADPDYMVVHSSIVDCNENILRGLNGGECETTGNDNLKTVKLVWAAYDSAASGKVIEL